MTWTPDDAAKMDQAAEMAAVELNQMVEEMTPEEKEIVKKILEFHMRWGRGPAGYKRLAKKYAAFLATQ